MNNNLNKFPEKFLWGGALAANQCEGGYKELADLMISKGNQITIYLQVELSNKIKISEQSLIINEMIK